MTGDCPACSGCGVNQKLRFKLRLFACGMLLAATLFCCLFVPIHSVAASINTVRIELPFGFVFKGSFGKTDCGYRFERRDGLCHSRVFRKL